MKHEIEIESSEGTIYVFPNGEISRFDTWQTEDLFSDVIGVKRFDLPRYATETGCADILDCGYWHENGYESPVSYN